MRRRGGFGSTVLRFLGIVVVFALFIAFMRAMHWDPFGAVDWIWHRIIDPIANMFSSNQTFREITSTP